MDVFVNIQPDPEMLKAFNETIANTVKNTREAFNKLQATADITAAKMATVGGAGGRGGGQKPPDTDAGRRSELAAQIRAASDELQRLRQLTGFTKAELQEIGQSDLAKPFNASLREASALSLELRQIRMAADMDEEAFADVEARIASIQSRVSGLVTNLSQSRAGSQIQLAISVDEADTVANIRKSISEIEDQIKVKKVGIELTAPRLVGSASGEDREKIYLLVKNLREAEIAAERFKKQIDGTPESFQRYEGAMNGVKEATEAYGAGLSEIEQVRGKSFNNLANNAYQLGQAFEDAAIGYQLNGITGAVRGASNNVSFLINDLSRVPLVQSKIANAFGTTEKKVADLLPLVSGIGAALLITVLPPTVEWLESLNDIKAEFDDISAILSRTSGDIDFSVELKNTRQQLEEAVYGAESFSDSLKSALDYSREIDDSMQSLGAKMQSLATDKVKVGLEDSLAAFDEAIKSIPEKSGEMVSALVYMTNKNAAAMELTGNQFSVFSEEAITGTKNQIKTLVEQEKSLQKQRNTIQEIDSIVRKVGAGEILSAEEITKTKDSLRELSDISKQLSEAGSIYQGIDVEAGFVEKLQQNISSVTTEFEAFSNASDEIAIKQQALQDSLGETVKKFSQLMKIDLTAVKIKELEGLLTPEAGGLIEIANQAEKIGASFLELKERLKDQGASDVLLSQVQKLADRTIQDRSKLSLLERQKDLEDQILKIYEQSTQEVEKQTRSLKSQSTTLEDLSRNLQQNVLSSFEKENEFADVKKQRQTELLQLAERLNQVNMAIDVGGKPSLLQNIATRPTMESQMGMMMGVGGIAGAVEQSVYLAKIAALLQKTVEGLGGVTSAQSETKDAIKQQDTKARAGQ
jgi:hypothetical protein